MFEWVLNTPLKTFILVFHCSFLINIYKVNFALCYLAKFFAKKNLYMGHVIKICVLSKSFKIFRIIISIIKLDCSIPFQKKDAFTGINI